jgi:hypothetical protein
MSTGKENMKTKKCTKCNVVKALTEFNKRKASKDGLDYRCRECDHVANHIWHKNPENRKRRKKAWVKNSIKAYKSNPQRKIATDIRIRNRYIIKNIETVNDETVMNMLGCSRTQFKAHIEKHFKPGMSWNNHGAWHQEHDKPLSKFDLLDEKQVKIANHYTNIYPMWGLNNYIKYNKNV